MLRASKEMMVHEFLEFQFEHNGKKLEFHEKVLEIYKNRYGGKYEIRLYIDFNDKTLLIDTLKDNMKG